MLSNGISVSKFFSKKSLLFSLIAVTSSGAVGHLLKSVHVVYWNRLQCSLIYVDNCSVGLKEVASEWNVSVNAVARTNADQSMAIGWITWVQCSLAVKIGRRPIYLFASACQFFACQYWVFSLYHALIFL